MTNADVRVLAGMHWIGIDSVDEQWPSGWQRVLVNSKGEVTVTGGDGPVEQFEGQWEPQPDGTIEVSIPKEAFGGYRLSFTVTLTSSEVAA